MTTKQKKGIPLSEVLKTPSLKDSKILTGKDRLDRIVTGVTVGEVPDIANWLTGGELVLSTLFAVSRDPEAIRWFAQKVIASPAAALAIKPARFMESLPPDALELASAMQFPVIEVPPDVRWTTITAEIYEMMAGADSSRLNGNIDNELLHAAIDGRGLRSIVQSISKKMDAPIVVFDYLDGIVAQAMTSDPLPDGFPELIGTDALRGFRERSTNGGGRSVVDHFKVGELEVYAAHVTIGWERVAVVMTAVPYELDQLALGVLQRAAEAVAIETARTRAIEEAEVRAYGDFLNDLIAGRIPLEQIESRLAKLGSDISGGYSVICCDLPEIQHEFGRFYREASRAVKGDAKGSLLVEHDGGMVALLAHSKDQAKADHIAHAQRLGKKFLQISRSLKISIILGVSRPRSNASELLKALDEAKVALDFGRRIEGEGSITKFEEVGIYRLLLPLAREAMDDGRMFYDETIGLLVEYDRRHGTNLVETLECFRRNNENIAVTAEELFAHRHTIRYRLQRIAEITGFDPFTGTERDRLYMGLYVKHLLNFK